jgi:hypothetical protein
METIMTEMPTDPPIGRNYRLSAEIHEGCLKEKDGSVDLCCGYVNSLAKAGRLRETLDVFSYRYRLQGGNDGGFMTQEKIRHLATALLDTIIANTTGPSLSPARGFACRICDGILVQPVTTACGHTFCRRCVARDASTSCRQCGQKIVSGAMLVTNVLMKGLSEKWWADEVRAARLREEGDELFQRNEADQAMAKYGEALQIGECSDRLSFVPFVGTARCGNSRILRIAMTLYVAVQIGYCTVCCKNPFSV